MITQSFGINVPLQMFVFKICHSQIGGVRSTVVATRWTAGLISPGSPRPSIAYSSTVMNHGLNTIHFIIISISYSSDAHSVLSPVKEHMVGWEEKRFNYQSV